MLDYMDHKFMPNAAAAGAGGSHADRCMFTLIAACSRPSQKGLDRGGPSQKGLDRLRDVHAQARRALIETQTVNAIAASVFFLLPLLVTRSHCGRGTTVGWACSRSACPSPWPLAPLGSGVSPPLVRGGTSALHLCITAVYPRLPRAGPGPDPLAQDVLAVTWLSLGEHSQVSFFFLCS